MQNAAGNAVVHAAVRANGAILSEVNDAVANMARAQTEDNRTNTRDMNAAAATLKNSSLRQSDVEMHPGFTNVLENRDDVVRNLKNTVRFL